MRADGDRFAAADIERFIAAAFIALDVPESDATAVAGLMVEAGWSLNLAKLVMIMIFLLITSPTSSHALAHAALAHGLKPWTKGDGDKAGTDR